MATTSYKTPDVYIDEVSTFPPSVAEVGTAIPAFIGYTEKAKRSKDGDLHLKPTKIYSLADYELLFGLPYPDPIHLMLKSDGAGGYVASLVNEVETAYLLYYAVKLYFDNGGAECYVVSASTYPTAASAAGAPAAPIVEIKPLTDALDATRLEDEPTLLVIPDAVKLPTYAEYESIAQAMLKQCGDLGDRFAILDLWHGDKETYDTVIVDPSAAAPADQTKNVIDANREAWTTNLKYGAAYYPFIKTAINPYYDDPDPRDPAEAGRTSNVTVNVPTSSGPKDVNLTTLRDPGTPDDPVNKTKGTKNPDHDTGAYNVAKAEIQNHFVIMPPSGAIAGVYAATDGSRGVWKAPANVALASVIGPVTKLTNLMQEPLNVDVTSGKSINAIRSFAGKGTLVWGARTLAGNDNEWRYVPVRRFFTMVEMSVKKSTFWAVFEPNDANLWAKVRGMVENYLIDKWRDGALAGATPKDAFYVRCGIGTTMTSQDILEGRMIVEIGMAAVRPAEFIVYKFMHKLQTS